MAVVRAVHHVSVQAAQDILEGTDWSSLEHAYGSADQLPSLLPGLLSEDAAVAGRVLGVLDAVLHQGTIYTCTTPTALFVASILSDPRVEISCESPLPWDERRRPLRAALLEWLGSFAESCTYDDENQAETNAPTRASQAIRPDLYQAIAPFVWADDPAVRSEARRAATYLLRAPELSDRRATLAEKMLLTAAQTEPVDRVRLAWILDSWGIAPYALISDPDPAVRACAAAAEALDSDPNALAEIRAALRDPDVSSRGWAAVAQSSGRYSPHCSVPWCAEQRPLKRSRTKLSPSYGRATAPSAKALWSRSTLEPSRQASLARRLSDASVKNSTADPRPDIDTCRDLGTGGPRSTTGSAEMRARLLVVQPCEATAGELPYLLIRVGKKQAKCGLGCPVA